VQITRQPSDTFLAQVQLSQLLFDFGKTLANHAGGAKARRGCRRKASSSSAS